MRMRSKAYGNKNLIGANVEKLRKKHGMKQKELVAQMQSYGVDINPSSLSKLEGQTRAATDAEVRAIAAIFKIPMEALFTS